MSCFKKVGIIGPGNYGTALAQCFSARAEEVLTVGDIESVASDINNSRTNKKSLPGIRLNENISCSCDFSKLRDREIIFIVVPATAVPCVCEKIKKLETKAPLVLCSKGFDAENGRLQSDLVEEILENDYAILSGPSFANEIAQGLPAGVNVASANRELSKKIAEALSSDTFKIEAIDDYIGLQVAGALKNVLAIGCGILSGLKLGDSAVAKLIVCGLREVGDLIVALGGKRDALLELGGIGDMILTCAGKRSRNVAFGEWLAGGGNVDDWKGPLAEGAAAVRAIPTFERKCGVKLKILSEIYKIVYEKKPVAKAIEEIVCARR
ncbi:MAG: NAD(P)H-dependent glycerol-3-phosphate dehydrogenase [Holosporaceae bacterium]|jgi:glycerol-3-phosphate dehydrogenase (NAD(P)+)|nr:NAD(P)H-dependent glycerol-3-phosphate dehydrogenase [Holosporaceae bacterium]